MGDILAKPKGYSRAQIGLHWVVAALIVFQVVFGEEMGQAWRAVNQGIAPQMTPLVWGHILGGAAVWLLAVWRLYLRRVRGVPAPLPDQPRGQVLAAEAVHWLFYAIMIIAPITGALAWFGGVHQAGEMHESVKPVIVLLVVLHVGAALYHHFVKKDGLLQRMRQAQD
jgi:cytochrome b561